VRFGDTECEVSYERDDRPAAGAGATSFGPLVGASPPMQRLVALLARAAASDAGVLVQAETGSGKELVARALHDGSARRDEPFVIVDCAALPENLLESELFGHARGAFTGAVNARSGAFEDADKGTLFLDEIGELPLAMQPKLLRVLESRTIRRLGETSHRPVDVRVVAATHRDLRTMVNAGTFREDRSRKQDHQFISPDNAACLVNDTYAVAIAVEGDPDVSLMFMNRSYRVL
jgi:transcriptional regulator with GAF, ATPase, and Fis domain